MLKGVEEKADFSPQFFQFLFPWIPLINSYQGNNVELIKLYYMSFPRTGFTTFIHLQLLPFYSLAFSWRSLPILTSLVFLVMIVVDGQTHRGDWLGGFTIMNWHWTCQLELSLAISCYHVKGRCRPSSSCFGEGCPGQQAAGVIQHLCRLAKRLMSPSITVLLVVLVKRGKV